MATTKALELGQFGSGLIVDEINNSLDLGVDTFGQSYTFQENLGNGSTGTVQINIKDTTTPDSAETIGNWQLGVKGGGGDGKFIIFDRTNSLRIYDATADGVGTHTFYTPVSLSSTLDVAGTGTFENSGAENSLYVKTDSSNVAAVRLENGNIGWRMGVQGGDDFIIRDYTNALNIFTLTPEGTSNFNTSEVSISNNSGPKLILHSTDGTLAGGDIIGAIEFEASDSSEDGSETQAFIKAISKDASPDSILKFGTLQNIGSQDDSASEKLTIAENGLVYIGVDFDNQRNAWQTSTGSGTGRGDVLQIGKNFGLYNFSDTNQHILSNAYYDGAWTLSDNDANPFGVTISDTGTATFRRATNAGDAGDTFSWDTIMTLDNTASVDVAVSLKMNGTEVINQNRVGSFTQLAITENSQYSGTGEGSEGPWLVLNNNEAGTYPKQAGIMFNGNNGVAWTANSGKDYGFLMFSRTNSGGNNAAKIELGVDPTNNGQATPVFRIQEDGDTRVLNDFFVDGNATVYTTLNHITTSTSGSGGQRFVMDNQGTGGVQYFITSTNNSHGSLGGGYLAFADGDISGNDADKTLMYFKSEKVGFKKDVVAYNDDTQKIGTSTNAFAEVHARDIRSHTSRHAIRPTKIFDFANGKTLDPDFTFYRQSPGYYVNDKGYYVKEEFNRPRFDHDPMTGESLGLLMEQSRTNRIWYSNAFDNAEWIKDGVTVDVNTTDVLDPSGTNTATKVTQTATTGIHRFFDYSAALQYGSGTLTCMSLFVKPGANVSSVWLRESQSTGISRGFTFTTMDATPSYHDGVANYGWQKYSNGWYRIYFTYSDNGSITTVAPSLYLSTPSGGTTGSTDNYVYAWGFQLEVATDGASVTYPSSYIETTGSEKTRAQDACLMYGADKFFNPREGTIYAEARTYQDDAVEQNGVQQIFGFDKDNNSAYRFCVRRTNSLDLGDGTPRFHPNYRLQLVTSYVDYFPTLGGNGPSDFPPTPSSIVRWNDTAYHKTAWAYDATSFTAAFDGVYEIQVTGQTIDTEPAEEINRISIGDGPSAGPWQGHIKRCVYYNRKLGDEQLIEMTES